jgi:hypothetical protein
LIILECLCNDSLWCSLIYSSILSIDIWSFSFFIGNSFLSSLSIRKIAFSSYLLINSDSSLLTLSMLWLNDFFVFIWSLLLLSASTLSLSLFKIYCILNLYCSSRSNYRTCLLLSCLIVIKCTRFLWFVRIVSFNNSSMYILHNFKKTTIASSFLSWTS